MEHSLKKLKNGLRVLEVPVDGASSVTVLVLFGVGSRYESDKIAGLSHFLEHMYFKGSAKRPTAADISETVDAVGGEMNAFTSKEFTGYYIKVASQHGELALDVLSDMLQNPVISEEEIGREKGVIVEEIKMYEDQPMVYAGEIFEEHLFGKNPLGRQTIGTRQTVSSFKRSDFVSYRREYYTAENTLLVIAGNLDNTREKVEHYFHPENNNTAPNYPAVSFKKPEEPCRWLIKNTEQTHLWVGFRTTHSGDPDRFVLKVMAAVLGGGMSSRLFTQVRERRGLAYYVRANSELYLDSGYLVASAGVTTEKFAEAVDAIMNEMKLLKDKGVEGKELSKAKEYLKGKMLLQIEQSDNLAELLGMQEILQRNILTPEEISKRFDVVTAQDIIRVAGQYFTNDRLGAAVISSANQSEWINKNLKI